MIAPILPGAEGLAEILPGKVDYVMLDRMNYRYADWAYRKYGLEDKMTDDYLTGRNGRFPRHSRNWELVVNKCMSAQNLITGLMGEKIRRWRIVH